jgi:hypothetical protein
VPSALDQFLQDVSLAHDSALTVAHKHDGVVSASFLVQEFLQLVRDARDRAVVAGCGYIFEAT